MDKKTLHTLEYDKVLERLENYTSFQASRELALSLKPSTDLETVQRALAETSEARLLLDTQPETTIGGTRDIRKFAENASRGMILLPREMQDIKSTLVAARTLFRQFENDKELLPLLWETAQQIPPSMGLVDAISRTITERGEILDSASSKLSSIRSELKVSHDRLLSRMQRIISSKKTGPHLQEAIITQRDGRYVIPVRSESKGAVKGVVHDVSSSGQTVFVEPLQLVELNNKYREMEVAEKDEERRILAELSGQIGEHSYELISLVEIMAELDLRFAKAKYAEVLRATEPIIKPLKAVKNSPNPGLTLRLYQARHPLLEAETVVPIDLEIDPETYILLITGPNTGGKTVTLKTIGLMTCMAQAGMHIPAKSGSEISLYKNIFADIGDEQSIEQSLSTFSGHITNIIRILDQADQETLVVIDELGAGTDPQEGAALAQAILAFLVKNGIPTAVATHYPELKAYAHGTPGVINASMEFDLKSLRPTYHLTIGLPGRSNALAIAKRLGLRDDIIDLARSTIDPNDLRAEDLLNEIHRQRDLTRKAREAADHALEDTNEMKGELAERLEEIEDERLEIIQKAKEEAHKEVTEMQEDIRKLKRRLERAGQPLKIIQKIEKQSRDLEKEIEMPAARIQRTPPPTTHINRAIRLGDKVMLHSLGKEGIVNSLSEEQAEVQIGSLRIRVDRFDLTILGGKVEERKAEVEVGETGGIQVSSPGLELSLRGLRVDEALDALENYLDRAYMASLPFVRLVHGKGTGKLRDAVRRELKGHPHVSKFESGANNEGGDGVTVAFLKN